MDPLVIVSPHLDDAVLSCGQFMAGRADTVVVTVFTGTPAPRGMTTTYDRNCGFDNAYQAMARRRMEDQRALGYLAASSRHCGFVDHQYAPDRRPALEDVADAIAREVIDADAVAILAPVGLGHPDHLLVAAACRLLAMDLPITIYEELPYRVLHAEQVPGALAEWGVRGGVPEFIGTGELATKEQAMNCYTSQLWALDEHAIRCPERFWVPECD